MTGIVWQQWVDAERASASQMVEDYGVSKRDEKSMVAIRTFSPRLDANAVTPLVGTCGRIACLTGALALPANRIHIASPLEQATEQGEFLRG
jgi:hypothetical protein